MRRTLLISVASLLFTWNAHAYTLGSAERSRGEITRLGKGLKEIGIDNILLLNYDKPEGQDGELRAAYLGGLTFRYFLFDNTALTLQLQGLYRREAGDISTAGFFGTLGAAYYFRLGYGLFISPGVAAGGYYGGRDTPISQGSDGSTIVESKPIYGGLARAKVGLVYYAGPRFNLHAGPEVIFQFGSIELDDDNLSTFTMDSGFNVGASYVF